MKKIGILILLFALYTFLVCHFSVITEWDKNIIIFVQEKMSNLPDWTINISGQKLYDVMLYIPMIIGGIYFAVKKHYLNGIMLILSPYIAYWFNLFFKGLINRPRPPLELQIGTHTATASYVSTHTMMMMCLWGLIIFYMNKYCKNQTLKFSVNTFSVVWILLSGFNRIWLGVHHPTDVIGAYILGLIFILIYVRMAKFDLNSQ
ncbi:phosphatase PAP2 family protein [bacterium]|nr:phosphatase PAP2 family protein [bacterium]